MRGIEQLLSMLVNKTVQGFLVDRNTYYHFTNRVKEEKYKHIAKRMTLLDISLTEKFLTQKVRPSVLTMRILMNSQELITNQQ